MDPAKLKVVELRAELSSRGLDVKGVKAVLVERLKKALGIDAGGEGNIQDDTDNVEAPDTPVAPRTPRGGRSRRRSPSPRIDEVSTPRRTSRRKSSVEEPAPTPAKIQHSLEQITESEVEHEEQSTATVDKTDDSPMEVDSAKAAESLYSIQESKTYDEEEEVTSQDDVSDSVLGRSESHDVSLDSRELVSSSDNDKEDVKSLNVTGIEPLAITPDERSEAGDVAECAKDDEAELKKDEDEETMSQQEKLLEPKQQKEEEEQQKEQRVEAAQQQEVQEEAVNQEEDKVEEQLGEEMGQNDDELEDKLLESDENDENMHEAACKDENFETAMDEEKEKSLLEEEDKAEDDDNACLIDDNLDESDSNKDNLSESVKLDESASDSPHSLDTSKSKVQKKEKRSRWGNFQDQKQEVSDKLAKAEEAKAEESRRGTKRKHSSSRSPVKMLCEEDEVKLENSESNVLLSWYDSDLHLTIDCKTLCGGIPLTTGALSHTWAGARSNKGVNKGRVAYEVLVDKHLKVDQNDDSHLIRVGFSACTTSLQLGEEQYSYGYESSGKFVNNNEFSEYGEKISEDDVIGVYLDMDSTPCTIKYTVNGKEQGIGKEFDKADLRGKALFPHVLTKNVSYRINFGQDKKSLLNRPKVAKSQKDCKDETKTDEKTEKVEEGDVEMTNAENSEVKEIHNEGKEIEELSEIQSILPGYEYIGKVSLENLEDGLEQPATRKECEVLMLCGLPGVGKTHWVEKWVGEHPEKRYTVLGTHELVSRMKVSGKDKKSVYQGSWQSLLESCSKSISELINIAGKRRRNFIIDQNNVYTAVQIRKISNFGDFVRKAVVVVPSQEEWDKRKSSRGELVAEEVTESEMLTMKANFVLPEVNEYFDEVIFADLPEKEAKEIIGKYNLEGKEAGYAMRPAKRSRFDTSSDRSSAGDRSTKSSSQSSRQNSDRRYNSSERNRSDRRSNERTQGFNRRGGGNDHRKHNDHRMERGGAHQRWGGPPRFGGPPPPPPHWGGGGGYRNSQWRGGMGGRERQPGNWRGGDRGHHAGRADHGGHHRGMGGGGFRGGPPVGGQPPLRGGAGQPRDAGRWNRGGQQSSRGGGDSRRGVNAGGRGGHSQGQGGHWAGNNSGWSNNGQQWNQQQWGGEAQGWGAQGHDQQVQDWSGQNWNQNWQQQYNQQNWGNGWKGYGQQNWGQYWNQWNQQGQQAAGANTGSTEVSGGGQNPSQATGGATSTASSSQYSTSYPNVQYSGSAGSNTNTSSSGSNSNQYPAQYSTDGNGSVGGGSNQTPEQMAQVYQSWAQYAQAFANYGQHQNSGAANNQKSGGGGMVDKKKKK